MIIEDLEVFNIEDIEKLKKKYKGKFVRTGLPADYPPKDDPLYANDSNEDASNSGETSEVVNTTSGDVSADIGTTVTTTSGDAGAVAPATAPSASIGEDLEFTKDGLDYEDSFTRSKDEMINLYNKLSNKISSINTKYIVINNEYEPKSISVYLKVKIDEIDEEIKFEKQEELVKEMRIFSSKYSDIMNVVNEISSESKEDNKFSFDESQKINTLVDNIMTNYIELDTFIVKSLEEVDVGNKLDDEESNGIEPEELEDDVLENEEEEETIEESLDIDNDDIEMSGFGLIVDSANNTIKISLDECERQLSKQELVQAIIDLDLSPTSDWLFDQSVDSDGYKYLLNLIETK